MRDDVLRTVGLRHVVGSGWATETTRFRSVAHAYVHATIGHEQIAELARTLGDLIRRLRLRGGSEPYRVRNLD